TSSGFSARSSLGLKLPAAQTIASAMFDLPEPFGPTTTATPGSRRTSTDSGNDLKPRRRMERRCTRGKSADQDGREAQQTSVLLAVLGHREHLLPRHLSHHLRMGLLDMLFDIGDELVIVFAA